LTNVKNSFTLIIIKLDEGGNNMYFHLSIERTEGVPKGKVLSFGDMAEQASQNSAVIEVNRYEHDLEKFCREPSHIKDADCSFSPWV